MAEKQSENIANLEIAAKQAVLYNDALQDSKNLTRELLLNQSKALEAGDKRIEIAQTQRDLTRELNELEKAGMDKRTKAYKTAVSNLDAAKQMLDNAKKRNKAIQATKAGLTGVNDTMRSVADSAEDFVKSLPGGNALVKLFGVDQLADGFTDSLNAAGSALMSGKGLKGAMSAFSGGIAGLINPVTVIIALIAGLVATFINFEKRAQGVADATGLTLSQSKLLVKEAKNVSASTKIQLATSEDILEVQKATVKEFGIANMLSTSQAANVADIGRSFGIGAAKAAEVTNEFMRMGMGGADAANALQDVSAEALKAGVSVGAVTADIAANAKDVAKYFGGNVKALRKAAVEAAKLGVSLATMAKVSDGLLSFEESIASQFEFQAMTGKMINFDKARQLALDGKIAEATQEVLSNVGSLAEFDAMRPMAQRKLAQATGMTVSELTKSLAIQEKLTNATEAEAAAAMGLGLSAAEIASKSPEQLKTLLAQQEASGTIAKDFAALKDQLSASLIPLGRMLLSVFSAVSAVVGAIVEGFSVLGPILKVIGILLSPILLTLGAMAMVSAWQAALATFSAIPIVGFGLAAVAAIGAVGAISKLMNVGDLGIDPNGGPVVMSPREGGLFQGTKNDGVSMSPSHGAGGGGGGNVAAAIAQTNALLRQILETGTVLELDGQLVGKTLRTSDSFRRR